MNEERGNTQTPPAQGSQPPARPTSAVNAGFDASKLGGAKNKKSDKPRKAKKTKKEKMKSPDNHGSSQKSKRPLWFWLVLGILGVAVLGAVIWAVVMLVRSVSGDTTPTLVLDDNASSNEGVENEAVNNYVSQLQKIYDANSNDDSNNAAGMEKVTQAVDGALKTQQGEAQAGSIRVAAMVVAYQNSDYDKALSLAEETDPDTLSLQDQIKYYATLYVIYSDRGDAEKAREVFKIESEKYQQLCSTRECMQ